MCFAFFTSWHFGGVEFKRSLWHVQQKQLQRSMSAILIIPNYIYHANIDNPNKKRRMSEREESIEKGGRKKPRLRHDWKCTSG